MIGLKKAAVTALLCCACAQAATPEGFRVWAGAGTLLKLPGGSVSLSAPLYQSGALRMIGRVNTRISVLGELGGEVLVSDGSGTVYGGLGLSRFVGTDLTPVVLPGTWVPHVTLGYRQEVWNRLGVYLESNLHLVSQSGGASVQPDFGIGLQFRF